MKTGKRILCFLLAVVMSCGVGLAGNSMKAEAEATVTVPQSVRCGVGMRNNTSISISLPSESDSIKNIKVYEGKKTTKNLVVKQTSHTNGTYTTTATLALYAEKKGTYKIKFDVYKSKKSKRSSHTVTVRARGNYGGVLDTVTVGGKKIYDVNKKDNKVGSYYHYTTAKSGKVKFKLDEGCKITKITVSTYNKKNSSAPVDKSFKNGKKLTFGKYGYKYSSSYGWNKPMWAPTNFTIYYTDKYNKGVESFITFVIFRKAEN